MPISKKHNLLFIHNPKCGGSSIEQYFGMSNNHNVANRETLFGLGNIPKINDEKGGRRRIQMMQNNFIARNVPLQHLTPTQMIDYGFITRHDFLKYVSFVFVRNPWDKLISSYKSYHHRLYPNFDKFLEWVVKIVEHEKTDEFFIYKDGRETVNTHFKEQYKYLNYHDERLVNYVGRYENYEEEIIELCEIIGEDYRGIGKLNITKNKDHYSNYYTDEQRDLVGDIYKTDIELFDYKFERV